MITTCCLALRSSSASTTPVLVLPLPRIPRMANVCVTASAGKVKSDAMRSANSSLRIFVAVLFIEKPEHLDSLAPQFLHSGMDLWVVVGFRRGAPSPWLKGDRLSLERD